MTVAMAMAMVMVMVMAMATAVVTMETVLTLSTRPYHGATRWGNAG